MPVTRIRERAEAFRRRLEGIEAEVIPGLSVIGGGATPDQALPTWLVAISGDDVIELERTLRAASPPVIARIEENRLVLDLRTVFESEEERLAGCLQQAVASYARSR
jgi:L-seryl-tRNA(Ser) seleniumtransferase